MPRKTKTASAGQAVLPQIPAELLEKLIPGSVTPGQLADIFQQFKKAFIQQVLGAEMSHHLGYALGQAKPEGAANHRNGRGAFYGGGPLCRCMACAGRFACRAPHTAR